LESGGKEEGGVYPAKAKRAGEGDRQNGYPVKNVLRVDKIRGKDFLLKKESLSGKKKKRGGELKNASVRKTASFGGQR